MTTPPWCREKAMVYYYEDYLETQLLLRCGNEFIIHFNNDFKHQIVKIKIQNQKFRIFYWIEIRIRFSENE